MLGNNQCSALCCWEESGHREKGKKGIFNRYDNPEGQVVVDRQ